MTTVPAEGSAKNSRRRLAVQAAPWVAAGILALPRICLAVDPLHPLGGTTLELIIGRVIAAILGVLGSVSLAMFVYGGITWMTAAGNDEKIKKAKNTIVYAVLGLIVAFGSFAFLRLFLDELLVPALRRTGS